MDSVSCQDDSPIKSINWHLTSRCNYACKFCFAHDRGKELVDEDRIYYILSRLRKRGIEKINFAGGEPLLHPKFFEILHAAKEVGFVTSIVTNGSLIDRTTLDRCQGDLDWIGISIDSSSDSTEKKLGRGVGHHVEHAVELIDYVHEREMRLKINTVVTKLNYQEEIGPFIESLRPHRWKVFQYLHMQGCNDSSKGSMEVTPEQFSLFVRKNEATMLRNGVRPVFERNHDMLESYLMLSPDGDLTLDQDGTYMKVGWEFFDANPINTFMDASRYNDRGGVYHW